MLNERQPEVIVLGTIMWLVLSMVLRGPAQQSNLDFFCVLLRVALLSRFLPEAMNLPPDERGCVGEGGIQRK